MLWATKLFALAHKMHHNAQQSDDNNYYHNRYYSLT